MSTEKMSLSDLSGWELLDEMENSILLAWTLADGNHSKLSSEEKKTNRDKTIEHKKYASLVKRHILGRFTVVKVEMVFQLHNFLRFSGKSRGYDIINPSGNKENKDFLSFLSKEIDRDIGREGIVVCALGFGNLDHEFPMAKRAVKGYKRALGEVGVKSEEIVFDSNNITKRGAYLFVPHIDV